MNILYHFRTRGTGAEAVHIAGIVRAFEKRGHSIFLSSPSGVDPRITAGASPFGDSASPSGGFIARASRLLPGACFEIIEILYNLPAFIRNLTLIRRHGCELIYERHAFFLFSTAIVAGLSGCPFVVEVNELVGDPRIRAQPMFSALARWTDRFVFRRATLVLPVSPHLQRRIMEYGVPAERILLLPNAVSMEELAIQTASARIRDALPKDAFLLGFAGWFVEWHRLDFIIDALAAPEFGKVVFVLIGEGPFRGKLEAQARDLNVKLHFTGALPHSEIPGALRQMDACVVPHSNAYRSPIKLFEFMAQERAVIAPRTEPIEQCVHDGEDALLFSPLEKTSFQSALYKVLESKDLRDKLGFNARRLVERNHTWEGNILRILERLP